MRKKSLFLTIFNCVIILGITIVTILSLTIKVGLKKGEYHFEGFEINFEDEYKLNEENILSKEEFLALNIFSADLINYLAEAKYEVRSSKKLISPFTGERRYHTTAGNGISLDRNELGEDEANLVSETGVNDTIAPYSFDGKSSTINHDGKRRKIILFLDVYNHNHDIGTASYVLSNWCNEIKLIYSI